MNESHLLVAQAGLAQTDPTYVPRTRHLDADGRPKFTNRLVLEASPYLRQHAHNPVDWRPYGPEALQEAVARDVPVFLSVGYSTCHWCHVMEHESFEDEEIASFLNAHFVSIKVDREDRPDVDAVYMEVLQALSGGGGGWPMNVVLTPTGAPLFAGTYFPPRDSGPGARPGGGRPGFLTLLAAIAGQWRDPKFAEQGHALLHELSSQAVSPPGAALPTVAVLETGASAFRRAFDEVHGGFGTAPKFPRPAVLDHLLRESARTSDASLRHVAEKTLERMACGGMYDHVAGGFARYSTDNHWLVPHFEKMLYDNAQLASSYLDASLSASGVGLALGTHFAYVARDVLAWLDREMSDDGGGFHSATDADSEGEEGRFFVWTTADIEAALPPLDARWVKETFDVSKAGNFPEVGGTNILNLRAPLSEADRERWDRVRLALAEVRNRRVHPGRDDKVVAAWNGFAISAFARAGVAFGEPGLVARAERAAAFVRHKMADTARPGRLLRSWRRGVAGPAAVLEDYAANIGACLDLFEATGDPRHLQQARAWQATQDELFSDNGAGGYFRTPSDALPLPIREKPEYDGSEPSGNALSAMNLLRLSEITSDAGLRDRGESTIRALDRLLQKAPHTVPKMLCAVDFALAEVKQIVLVGTPDQTAPFQDALRARSLPNTIVVLARPGGGLDLPLLSGRTATADHGIAYVCVGQRCELPANTPTELLERLL